MWATPDARRVPGPEGRGGPGLRAGGGRRPAGERGRAVGAGALARRAPCPPADTFVFNLALADLGLALTLPFCAAESTLDSHWPFGAALCKAVLTATVLNVYASIFLVTALSVARYWVVAMATGPGTHLSLFWARTATLAVRAAAALATLPTAIFGAEGEAWGVRLLRFPSRYWLGAYQLRRVALAFVMPLGVISTSHVLLLAFLQDGGGGHRAAGWQPAPSASWWPPSSSAGSPSTWSRSGRSW